MKDRVKVVYTNGGCQGKERWLEPASGRLFVLSDSRRSCNSGFWPTGEGWSNDRWSVRLVGTPDPIVPAAPAASIPEGGLKFDAGKPRWSLLMQGCAKALAGVAAVLTFGAAKYAAHSWKQVENNKERYRDAMYRHLNAIEAGEVLDPESGLPHWDHVACNALFLSELNKEAV